MPTRPPKAQRQRVPGASPPPKPRPTAAQRGYDSAWQKARVGYLAKHPWCECPEHRGRPGTLRSDTIDHIIPHRGDQKLRWDVKGNWRAMNRRCHSRKTASTDGGFGNKRGAA